MTLAVSTTTQSFLCFRGEKSVFSRVRSMNVSADIFTTRYIFGIYQKRKVKLSGRFSSDLEVQCVYRE